MTKVFTIMRPPAALAIAMWFGAFALPLHGQDLRLHVSEDSVTVGQRFFVSIAAEHDFAADPVFPEPTDTLTFGDLEVLRRHARNSFTREDMRIDSVVYEVVTFALDTATVLPIPVLFTAGEDTFSVWTTPAHVSVISLVPPDAQDVRGLAPLVEFPRAIWPYVAGGALLLLLAGLLAVYLWKRRERSAAAPLTPAAPVEPPDVEAFKRLRALEGVDLTRREAVQPFYVELSETVRHYLARRLHVNAMETTTRELIGDLSRRDIPNADTRSALQSVLTLADYVKFADAVSSPEEGRAALSTAGNVVASIEEDLRPPEPSSEAAFVRDDDHSA